MHFLIGISKVLKREVTFIECLPCVRHCTSALRQQSALFLPESSQRGTNPATDTGGGGVWGWGSRLRGAGTWPPEQAAKSRGLRAVSCLKSSHPYRVVVAFPKVPGALSPTLGFSCGRRSSRIPSWEGLSDSSLVNRGALGLFRSCICIKQPVFSELVCLLGEGILGIVRGLSHPDNGPSLSPSPSPSHVLGKLLSIQTTELGEGAGTREQASVSRMLSVHKASHAYRLF